MNIKNLVTSFILPITTIGNLLSMENNNYSADNISDIKNKKQYNKENNEMYNESDNEQNIKNEEEFDDLYDKLDKKLDEIRQKHNKIPQESDNVIYNHNDNQIMTGPYDTSNGILNTNNSIILHSDIEYMQKNGDNNDSTKLQNYDNTHKSELEESNSKKLAEFYIKRMNEGASRDFKMKDEEELYKYYEECGAYDNDIDYDDLEENGDNLINKNSESLDQIKENNDDLVNYYDNDEDINLSYSKTNILSNNINWNRTTSLNNSKTSKNEYYKDVINKNVIHNNKLLQNKIDSVDLDFSNISELSKSNNNISKKTQKHNDPDNSHDATINNSNWLLSISSVERIDTNTKYTDYYNNYYNEQDSINNTDEIEKLYASAPIFNNIINHNKSFDSTNSANINRIPTNNNQYSSRKSYDSSSNKENNRQNINVNLLDNSIGSTSSKSNKLLKENSNYKISNKAIAFNAKNLSTTQKNKLEQLKRDIVSLKKFIKEELLYKSLQNNKNDVENFINTSLDALSDDNDHEYYILSYILNNQRNRNDLYNISSIFERTFSINVSTNIIHNIKTYILLNKKLKDILDSKYNIIYKKS